MTLTASREALRAAMLNLENRARDERDTETATILAAANAAWADADLKATLARIDAAIGETQ